MTSRQFRVVVDGRGMNMILPNAVTIEEAWTAASARFGAQRVQEVTPV